MDTMVASLDSLPAVASGTALIRFNGLLPIRSPAEPGPPLQE